MMTVFVGLILFMIVVFMIVNGSFLEKYYISNKKSEFIKAYTMVQEGVENGTIDSETPEKDLGRFTEKNNISIAVIDSEYNVVYTNVREKQMMVVQLFGYLYDKNHQEVLEKTFHAEKYVLSKTRLLYSELTGTSSALGAAYYSLELLLEALLSDAISGAQP